MKYVDRILQRWRIAVAARVIPAKVSLLDIGCANANVLYRCVQPSVYVGIDPEAHGTVCMGDPCRIIKGRFPDDLPQVERFDVIAMLAVLEHIPPARQSAVADACWTHLIYID